MKQQTFPNIRRANHANLGKVFEHELDAVHQFYLSKGIVKMVWNKNDWEFPQGKAMFGARKGYTEGSRTVARTGNGSYLVRTQSECDFSGGNDRGSYIFDAKETSQNRFPLHSISEHQVNTLRLSAKCGVIAGAMVKFTESDRVFFVPIHYLLERYDSWLIKKLKNKQAERGTASLSIADLEENAIEVKRHKLNGLWDWYAVIGKN